MRKSVIKQQKDAAENGQEGKSGGDPSHEVVEHRLSCLENRPIHGLNRTCAIESKTVAEGVNRWLKDPRAQKEPEFLGGG